MDLVYVEKLFGRVLTDRRQLYQEIRKYFKDLPNLREEKFAGTITRPEMSTRAFRRANQSCTQVEVKQALRKRRAKYAKGLCGVRT